MGKKQPSSFPTLLDLLKAFFDDHEVLKDEASSKYFVDEIKPENEIYVSNGQDSLYSLMFMLCEALIQTGEEKKVARAYAELQRSTRTKLKYFAPPWYVCPSCKIVVGKPASRYNNTLGQTPLSGHKGRVLYCARCGRRLGLDPNGIHTFS